MLLAVVPLAAQQATLGDEGVLYTARVGTYGSFFPRGRAYAADANVLVLEVQKPGGERTRLLAPGGETVAPDARAVRALGRSLAAAVHGVGGPLPHPLDGAPGRRSTAPPGPSRSRSPAIRSPRRARRASPSRARPTSATSTAKSVAGERTMLHIVWYEDDYGDVQVLYAPLALDNGATPRWLPPIFELGQFVPEARRRRQPAHRRAAAQPARGRRRRPEERADRVRRRRHRSARDPARRRAAGRALGGRRRARGLLRRRGERSLQRRPHRRWPSARAPIWW